MYNSIFRRIRLVLAPCLIMLASGSVATAKSTGSPPPESTSKVKKVLLYNKIGGWVAMEGIANVNQYMASLARAKGFELDSINTDTNITLEFLKKYQLIIWNNNSNGAASVPTTRARTAIVDYVHQGGSWLLIGLAGAHQSTWPALNEMLGTDYTSWGSRGGANMQADSSALKHPELRFVVNSLPQTIRLEDTWMAFRETVRPFDNVTILYTAQGGDPGVLLSNANASGDHTYVWARTIEKGKMLFCPPGWSNIQPNPLVQSDSALAKIYWNSMRWLADDFQNGCTDPRSLQFNPDARVDDGSCLSVGTLVDEPAAKQSFTQAPEKTRSWYTRPSFKAGKSNVDHDVNGRRLNQPPVMGVKGEKPSSETMVGPGLSP